MIMNMSMYLISAILFGVVGFGMLGYIWWTEETEENKDMRQNLSYAAYVMLALSLVAVATHLYFFFFNEQSVAVPVAAGFTQSPLQRPSMYAA